MSAFVQDSFTDADGTALASHAGETGAAWTPHPSVASGNLSILGNRLVASDAPRLYYASGLPLTAEYDVEAVVYVAGTGVAMEVEILGRLDAAALTYYMAEYWQGAAAWRLYKRVAGTFTQLGTFAQALSAGASYRLKLEIRDAAKKLYVDGVERISSADDAITAAGRAGVMFDTSGSAGGYALDGFTATDPVTDPPSGYVAADAALVARVSGTASLGARVAGAASVRTRVDAAAGVGSGA